MGVCSLMVAIPLSCRLLQIATYYSTVVIGEFLGVDFTVWWVIQCQTS